MGPRRDDRIPRQRRSWKDRRSSKEVLPLPLPFDGERLQELREPCRRPTVQDPFDDVGGEEREAQHPANVRAADPLGVGEVGERAEPPSSSMACQRRARASALTSVPSGCNLVVGAISLPSGATIRLRPPRRWNRIGIRTTRVWPSSLVSRPCVMQPFSRLLPKLPDEAGKSLGPDPHLERVPCRSTRSTRSWTIRACSAGNSSLQTVAKSASRTVTSRSAISSSARHGQVREREPRRNRWLRSTTPVRSPERSPMSSTCSAALPSCRSDRGWREGG